MQNTISWSDINVSAAKQKQFESREIYTVNDMLRYFPKGYKDFSVITGLRHDTEMVSAIVQVDSVQIKNEYGKAPTICARCTEKDTGKKLNVYWFHQNYLYGEISDLCDVPNVFVAGKLTPTNSDNFYVMSMPVMFNEYSKYGRRIVPVYKKIRGMSTEYLSGKISAAISSGFPISDTVPQKYLSRYNLPSYASTLMMLHFPFSAEEINKGRSRIIFDDLLFYALGNELMIREASFTSPFQLKAGDAFQKTLDNLPFTLTSDQSAVVEEMLNIAGSGNRLNALLQGDVGCGKTIVAFLMMMAAADSGYQSVLMAPTQILAGQHYKEFSEMCEKTGKKVVYLGSGMKKKERNAALQAVKDGSADFLIGTHSVLAEDVEFFNLGLMIIDEEHKFGVKQRGSVINRAHNGVHSVTMSATPIPRSFADALYGNNVKLFNILMKPEGRKEIKTELVSSLVEMCEKIKEEVQKGHQAYIVCPLIEESDKETMKDVYSVEQVAKECGEYFRSQGISYEVLTGRDKKDVAAGVISSFKEGAIDVLISTSVIEVGVNVPNATVMAVTSAERFGLSSLHQLRGRVGRNDLQSYCILQSDKGVGNERLSAMVREHDGFKIAEADLKIRGAGDFLGTEQSGNFDNYVELAMRYPDSYKNVQEVAREILDNKEEYGYMSILLGKFGQLNS